MAVPEIQDVPDTFAEWEELIVRMAAIRLNSDPRVEGTTSVTARDVLVRVDFRISHTHVYTILKKVAEGRGDAVYTDGKFVFGDAVVMGELTDADAVDGLSETAGAD